MKIITTAPVKHDGDDIEIGTTLDIKDRQAQDLIDADSAELPAKKGKVDKDEESK